MEKTNKIFIDKDQYQKKILDLILSEDLDKMIAGSIYKDNKDYKCAIIYGICLAGILTLSCDMYISKEDS